MKNKDIKIQDFLLHEYDKCFELFRLHYDVSDRLFKYYFTIIVGIASIFIYVNETLLQIKIHILNSPIEIKILLLLLCIINQVILLIFIEHKILTIYYVRSLNAIRNFFVKKSHIDASKYCLLPTNKDIPKYFILFRDFFWYVVLFSVVNSIFKVTLILNYIKNELRYCIGIIGFILFILIDIAIYWFRGKKQEKGNHLLYQDP